MVRDEPFEPDRPFAYECVQCGRRVHADSQPVECSGCGGRMRDLSVPRSQ